jgi:hypothetical protein
MTDKVGTTYIYLKKSKLSLITLFIKRENKKYKIKNGKQTIPQTNTKTIIKQNNSQKLLKNVYNVPNNWSKKLNPKIFKYIMPPIYRTFVRYVRFIVHNLY